jgi:hypothetical protein
MSFLNSEHLGMQPNLFQRVNEAICSAGEDSLSNESMITACRLLKNDQMQGARDSEE